MRELLTDIKVIIKKDRQVFITMLVLLGLAVAAIILGFANIHASSLPVWHRYFSFPPYYDRSKWYYLISFILVAVTLGGLHNIISVRLYKKQGKAPALIFLGLSILLVVLLIVIMLSIFNLNKETKIWI